jgi:hypothetical protein
MYVALGPGQSVGDLRGNADLISERTGRACAKA